MGVGGGLGALAGAAAARLAAAAALLVAAAAVVVIAGGGGLLGPLGALVGAGSERRSLTASSADGDARPGAPGAIVALAPWRSTRAGTRSTRGSVRAPGRRHATRPPGATPPGAGPSPSVPAPGRPPAPGAAPPAPPGPGEEPRVVDRVDQAVDGAAAQTPDPAQPAVEPVQDLVDAVVEACGRLPACP